MEQKGIERPLLDMKIQSGFQYFSTLVTNGPYLSCFSEKEDISSVISIVHWGHLPAFLTGNFNIPSTVNLLNLILFKFFKMAIDSVAAEILSKTS